MGTTKTSDPIAMRTAKTLAFWCGENRAIWVFTAPPWLGRIFAYRRIVTNTLFGSFVYSPNGPQYAKPKLS